MKNAGRNFDFDLFTDLVSHECVSNRGLIGNPVVERIRLVGTDDGVDNGLVLVKILDFDGCADGDSIGCDVFIQKC